MSIERKIGGAVYRFQELGGWDAYDALQLLFKVAGPLLPLLSAAQAIEEVTRTGTLVKLLLEVLQSHDAVGMRQLFEICMENCSGVGVKPQAGCAA